MKRPGRTRPLSSTPQRPSLPAGSCTQQHCEIKTARTSRCRDVSHARASLRRRCTDRGTGPAPAFACPAPARGRIGRGGIHARPGSCGCSRDRGCVRAPMAAHPAQLRHEATCQQSPATCRSLRPPAAGRRRTRHMATRARTSGVPQGGTTLVTRDHTEPRITCARCARLRTPSFR
jgi:hypothetical protein